MAKSSSKYVSGDNSPDDPLYNAVVDRCIQAWNLAYRKASKDDDTPEYQCEKTANRAFLDTMPPLVGRENIRNFIACVAQAAIMHVVYGKELTQLLYAAQVAIGANGREPKTIQIYRRLRHPPPPYTPLGYKKWGVQQTKSFRISNRLAREHSKSRRKMAPNLEKNGLFVMNFGFSINFARRAQSLPRLRPGSARRPGA